MALLNKIRRRPEQPQPGTEAEVDSALASLDNERQAITARLAQYDARERELVESDADDAAFDALDAEKTRDQRQLDRLDARERHLVELGARLRGMHQRAVLAELVEQYDAALRATVSAYSAAAAARWRLVELREQAAQRGLERVMPFLPLPAINLPLDRERLAHFEHFAFQELNALRAPDDPAPTFRLRFVRSSTHARGNAITFYRVGEVATFNATEANSLIAAGAATFYVPPMPDDADGAR